MLKQSEIILQLSFIALTDQLQSTDRSDCLQNFVWLSLVHDKKWKSKRKVLIQGVLWCDNGSRNGSNVRFWLVHTLTAGTRSLAADLRSSISFCKSLDLFSYSSMFFFCWSMVCMRPLTSWLLRPPGPDPGVTAPPPPPELTALSRSIYRTGGAKVFFQEVLRDADKNFISFLYGSRHFKRGNHIWNWTVYQLRSRKQDILLFLKQAF